MSDTTPSQCTCNDESQTETKTCFNCKSQWSEQMPHHLRVNNCPQHRHLIAICRSPLPPLCQTCKDTGYSVKMNQESGWMPDYEVVKKN